MSPLDLWVYRERKQLAHGGSLLRVLERSITEIRRLRASQGRRRAAIDALVTAGELEAALADAADPLEEAVAQATDALALVVMGGTADLSICAEALAHARAPRSLAIRPPHGFAYHALHPQAYACVNELVDAREALVVGVRSIGTTLSAVTAAALRARGVSARRLTVRPDGPPTERRLTLAPEALEAIARARDSGAAVVIVDEGPGLSGASFLATGEAIVAAGVPRERIVLLGGRAVDPDRLRAPSAGKRWRAFRTAVAPSGGFAPARSATLGAALDVSGGAWRPLHYTCDEHWPAVVEAMERRKLVAGGRLFKFEGLGSSGHAARHRASALAAEGIALDPCDEGDGWTSYPWGGRPMQPSDLDATLIEHIAHYCARRPALCPLVSAESDLEPIVAESVARLLGGVSIAGSPLAALLVEGALAVERVATTDSRLAPHEWLRMADGSVRKTDAIAHGDDPLFPGPTDIAWDLAGAIVEWEMDASARERLLAAYRRASGDDAARRIDAWLVAYAAVRGAFNLFALETCGAAEARRLGRQVERYRAVVASYLLTTLAAAEPLSPPSGRA
ncbi:MAG: hypothetical protein KF795_13190 [Labilithrix sp.]|nr:hypothetical protein [Labilithrix sp.]